MLHFPYIFTIYSKGVFLVNTGTIKEVSFHSDALDETLNLYIYIPSSYTPMMNYPLIIAADGKDYIQLGRISSVMDHLIEDGDIDEAIIVAIPYKSVQDRRDKYLPQGSKHQAYLHFLKEELLVYMHEQYNLSDDADDRTLIGDSQAATVSLLGALAFPNTFGHVIMHSPLVNDDVLAIVQNATDVQAVKLYHAIGKGETEVRTTDHRIKDFLTPNRTLHALLVEKGFTTFYKELEGDHSWKTWQPDLKQALIKNFNDL